MYQGALLALLCAAHEYQHAHEEYENTRHSHRSIGGDAARDLDGAGGHVEPVRDDSPALEIQLFDELAVRNHVYCPQCSGHVEYRRWEPADRKDSAMIYYQCRSCDDEVARRFTFEQFKRALAAA